MSGTTFVWIGWALAGLSVVVLVLIVAVAGFVVARGARRDEARRERRCVQCGYDLSNTSMWPDMRRADPMPRCPECGRLIMDS